MHENLLTVYKQMTDGKLNFLCYIEILETIILKKISSSSFKDVIYKMY